MKQTTATPSSFPAHLRHQTISAVTDCLYILDVQCSHHSKFAKQSGVSLLREVFEIHFVISYHINLGFKTDPFPLVFSQNKSM